MFFVFRTILLRAALFFQVFCHFQSLLLSRLYLDTPTNSALHLSATMASADFCIFSTAFRLWLPFSERSMQTSPGTTRFFPSIYLPHLPPLVPCSYGTSTCSAALSPTIASYAVPVRQARGLPPTSFRFRLTTNTLVFGYVFPATGQTPVFHRLETCAAGRTSKMGLLHESNLTYAQPLIFIMSIKESFL